jgi:hypothetical protein
MASACHLSYSGSINGRVMIQASPSIKVKLYSKTLKAKRARNMAQVVESLLGKNKAQVQTPVLAIYIYIHQGQTWC